MTDFELHGHQSQGDGTLYLMRQCDARHPEAHMNRPTAERLAEIRELLAYEHTANARGHVGPLSLAGREMLEDLLSEIDALQWDMEKTVRDWLDDRNELRARVRELEQEHQGLIERFHAECCEVECKCHCDELRVALAPPQRSAP